MAKIGNDSRILRECEVVASKVRIGLQNVRIETKIIDGKERRIVHNVGKVHFFRNNPVEKKTVEKKTRPIAQLSPNIGDDCEGFADSEQIHPLRVKMFLDMLETTAENGLQPITADDFNRCFEQNEKHEDKNDIARISRDLKNILGELEGIAIVHGVKLR